MRLAVAGGAAALAGCGWDGGDAIRPLLLDWSLVNDWLGEKVFFSPAHLARTYSPAERSAMLPSYFISRSTPMLDEPDRWRLRVDGLVEQPLALSLDDLMRLPRASYTVKHHCVEGWSAIASWHGVPVPAIAARCRPLRTARYISFESFDAGYSNGWDLASAMHPQTILAYGMNGQDLPVPHGGPVRLRVERQLGYKNLKFLARLMVVDRLDRVENGKGSLAAAYGYSWYAGI
jgi:DMSO/TMAO reductase YedYZ molybdopterin-dependent catalytic subunit